jgi:serine/threonine-protein kinase
MEEARQEEAVAKHNSNSEPGYVLAINQNAPGTPYAVVQRLGQGGMGTVYEVRRPPGIRGAMKVLHPKWAAHRVFAERFVQEVALHAALEGHDNLVKVKDFGCLADSTPFVVMELLEGRTLHYVMRLHRKNYNRPMEPETVYGIAKQFCEGLSWLHLQTPAIVHRDFKPENVFVCQPVGTGQQEPRVKILDFGVAKLLDGTRDDGNLVGTPRYMAPEQISKGCNVTGAADTYAAALVIYEMLTGRMPFDLPADASEKQILEAHLWKKEIAPSVLAPWLPSKVDEVLLLGLDKNPLSRPPSPNALIDELKLLKWVTIDRKVAGDANITSPTLVTIIEPSRPKSAEDEHDTYQGFSLPPVEGPTLEPAPEELVHPIAPVGGAEAEAAPVAPMPVQAPIPAPQLAVTPAHNRPKATPTLEVSGRPAWPASDVPSVIPSVIVSVVQPVRGSVDAEIGASAHSRLRGPGASPGEGLAGDRYGSYEPRLHPAPHPMATGPTASAPAASELAPMLPAQPFRSSPDRAEALFFGGASQGGTALSLPSGSSSRPASRPLRRGVSVSTVMLALTSALAVVAVMLFFMRRYANESLRPATPTASSSEPLPAAAEPAPATGSAVPVATEPSTPASVAGSGSAASTPTVTPSAQVIASARVPVAPRPLVPRAAPAAAKSAPSDGRELLRDLDGEDPFRSKLNGKAPDPKPATHL